jgi:16S rRNA processing protein RimM
VNQPPPTLEIGYVAGVHGLRGEIVIRLFHAASNALATLDHLLLRTPAGQDRRFAIRAVRPLGKGLAVLLDGVSTREAADALRSSTVHALTAELPELDDDEVYLEDLRGLTARDTSGRTLGTVAGFMFTNIDIAVIQTPERGELLIPILDGTIAHVDSAGRTVELELPPGLLDDEDDDG